MTRPPTLPFTQAGDNELRNRVRLFGNLLGEVLHEQAGKEIFDAVETLRRGYIRLRKQENSKTRHRLAGVIEHLSPDALTGMEASLRFPGPETCDSKIFGRLSAWQNWIFQRPNAVGEKGALTLYGRPERTHFDYRRT